MKPFTLLLFFLSVLLCPFLLHAQGGCDNKEFIRKYSNGENNYIYKIINTADGGNLLVGAVREWYNNTSDALIIKTDGEGMIEWSKTIGANNQADQFFNVIQTSDGGFAAIGQSATLPYQTTVVCKLTASGNIAWSKGYPSFSFNGSHKAEIVELPSGGFAIAAIYSPFPVTQQGFILRIDNAGSIVWAKNYTTAMGQITNSNSIALQNDSLVVGGFCMTDPTQQGQFRYIMKVNVANGNIYWAKRWSNAGGDLFRNQAIFGDRFFTNHAYNGVDYVSMLDNTGAIAGTIRTTDVLYTGQINSFSCTADTGIVIPKIGGVGNATGLTFSFVKVKDMQVSASKAVILPAGDYVDYPVITSSANGNYTSALQQSGSSSVRNILLVKTAEDLTQPVNNCGFFNTGVSFENPVISSQSFTWPLITDYTFSATDVSLQANDIAFTNRAVCTSVTAAACNTIDIAGADTVCLSNGIFEYKAVRDIGCNSAVQFSIDNSFAQVTATTDSSTSLVFLQEGNTRIYVSLTTACGILKDSMDIFIAKNAQSLQLGPDLSFCGTASYTLSAATGFKNYLWQDGTTGLTHSATSAGIYHLTVTDYCDNIFRDSVVITQSLPELIDLGNDLFICKGDSVTIAGPPGFATYTWSPATHIISASTRDARVFPTADTKYYLHAEKVAGAGCVSVDSITIRLHPQSIIDLGADTSICRGSSILLDAGPGFMDYNWNTGTHSQTLPVSNAGEYIINARDINGCMSTDTFLLLALITNPTVNLDKNNSICTGSVRALSASNTPGHSWLWQDGSTAYFINVSDTGFYKVVVTDLNSGCTAADSVHINQFRPSPQNFLPQDISICSGTPVQLSPVGTFSDYNWSTGASSPGVTVSQAGLYTLTVTDAFNCKGKDSIRVSYEACNKTIYFPTAFTPNNDGLNDVFRASVSVAPKTFSLIIYNRYGEIVFRSNDSFAGWNGQYKNKLQDHGSYVWTAQYQFEGESPRFEKGSFTLIR